jgi:hypothetical protein
MPLLPDPRRFAGATVASLPADLPALTARVETALVANDDASVVALFDSCKSAADWRRVHAAVVRAVHSPDAATGAVLAHVFAFPVVIVAGSARPAAVPGVLGNVAALAAMLEARGATGTARNMGLSAGLADCEALDRLSPSVIRRWTLGAGDGVRDIAPAPIRLGAASEQASARFLVGAALTPWGAPTLAETASNIGSWGMEMTRLLGEQLGTKDIRVLALPRPPRPLLDAAHVGRFAELEVGLHLFVSNTARRIRMATGDPIAILSAHRLDRSAAGEIRLGLHSPFDDALAEGFSWPLHPLDDLDEIERRMVALMRDVRIGDVRLGRRVQPDLRETGGRLLPRPAETLDADWDGPLA